MMGDIGCLADLEEPEHQNRTIIVNIDHIRPHQWLLFCTPSAGVLVKPIHPIYPLHNFQKMVITQFIIELCNYVSQWVSQSHNQYILQVLLFTLTPQVIFYDGHVSNVYSRVLNVLWNQHIKYFMLKVGNSVHDNPNNNGSKLKLDNIFCN